MPQAEYEEVSRLVGGRYCEQAAALWRRDGNRQDSKGHSRVLADTDIVHFRWVTLLVKPLNDSSSDIN